MLSMNRLHINSRKNGNNQQSSTRLKLSTNLETELTFTMLSHFASFESTFEKAEESTRVFKS